MKALDGDPGLLLRADRRCAELALDLDRLETALERASGHASAQWSGAGAMAFRDAVGGHRRTLGEVHRVVTQMAASTRTFAHELADAQLRARQLSEESAERAAIESRITLLRKRFRQQLEQLETDVTQLLLQAPVDDPRWTGPVLPPDSHPRWTGPVLPPDSHPRWTGPVRPPGGWTPDQSLNGQRWTGPVRPPGDLTWPQRSIKPLPVAADRGPRAAELPWTPPWPDGSGGGSPHTRVQPIGWSA
ncbi:hypothetical protein GCM10011492_33460 [Flexivirga endophytica]|uniref:Uncharacterized protein n=1 Tax=Flexivirga endophytica TaxID=1849103 RepID=A0A916WWR0_9MICO|nr:hypothetical protein [Flexivirga endophytica]GGB39956.1 hypothetical protein GCM10011492_33460 [Flexivirga endophytica]GHB47846.1 hypothetical protein GCM10008112_15850 [Flexivirga endophytica]